MEILLTAVFLLGYLAISTEHLLKIDKLIPSLLMMVISWTILMLCLPSLFTWFDQDSANYLSIANLSIENKRELLNETLLHHFGKTAEILIFLIGAMAIVELVDHFDGFEIIGNTIQTNRKLPLLWVLSFVAFFLSAVIDNLTATLVLIAIIKKIGLEKTDRLWYVSFIVIAANAGGAWSPVGDVTTTMLWIENKITTLKLILTLFVPSLLNLLIPLLIASFLPVFKGSIERQSSEKPSDKTALTALLLGLTLIVLVPIFKTLTHLPPYVGMMLSLAIFSLWAEIYTNRKISFTDVSSSQGFHGKSPTLKALTRIEIPTLLFFLGILMTVAALETSGIIHSFGQMVSENMHWQLFSAVLGLSSAVIDNVPLVAASIGMLGDAGKDAAVWHWLAYTAGTGGSLLIIGSAAGVVAMGIENISFSWFLKKISWIALLGYLSGLFILYLFS